MQTHRKKALVVYESIFGNTRAVAEAVAEGLAASFEVEALEVSWVDAQPEADLLVVGGPIHAWGMSRERTRQDARAQAEARNQQPVSAWHGVREWLEGLQPNPGDVAAAAFDTGLKTRWFPVGSAARGEARELRRRGYRVLVAPEHFHVEGKDGPLAEGELERAIAWGRALAEIVRAEAGEADVEPVRARLAG